MSWGPSQAFTYQTLPRSRAFDGKAKGCGYGGWNIDPVLGLASTVLLTSQQVFYLGTYFLAGDVVTNLHFQVSVNAASPTAIYVGVYLPDATGLAPTLAQGSADVQAQFTSGAAERVITCPLSAPYTILSDTLAYLAILDVGGTTTTLRRSGAVAALGQLGTNPQLSGTQAGQNTLPNTGALAPNGGSVWAGWS